MRNRIQLVCAWLLVCLALPVFGEVPPAGTSVDNQAQVSYQLPAGSTGHGSSNTVHVITQRAEALTLTADHSVSGTPGSSVTFAHRLTNTGNSATDYALRATNLTGDDFDFSSLSVYVDSNGNGAVDDGEPLVLSGATVSLPIGGSEQLLVVATLPSSAPASATARVQISARSTVDGASASNTDAVTTSAANVPPVITYFGDGTFAHVITVTQLGLPLWLQANAASCNVDATAADTRPITLTSALTGDVETFVGTETGPNTGVFRVLPNVPTHDASQFPTVAGNGFLELRTNDTVTATITGCGTGTARATANILVDPSGMVFDSRSNTAVGNATVTLIDVTGDGNGGKPNQAAVVVGVDGVTPAPSTVVTAADGRFEFLNVLPSTYRLQVVPPNGYAFPSKVNAAQLPAGHKIEPQGSYGGNFAVTANGPVFLDVPLDPAAVGGLFVQKTPARQIVEVGEFLDYTIKVKNSTGRGLANVQVEDVLPVGFVYQAHSARFNNNVMADPQGGGGPRLIFSLGALDSNGDEQTITYRVHILPAALGGDATNRATASGSGVQSNTASTKVSLREGVFSDRGYVLGKVYLDCNGNRMQDDGEAGVPGVRLYMEDGTFVVTDNEGRYSFYGVTARTHIVKLDSYTLPLGSQLMPLTSRNAMDAGSQFVSLMNGHIERADFALSNCTPEFHKLIEARKNSGEGALGLETAQALKQNFVPERIDKTTDEIKGSAATGFVGVPATPGSDPMAKLTAANKLAESAAATKASAGTSANGAAGATAATASAGTTAGGSAQAAGAAASSAPQSTISDELLLKLGPELDFIDLADHDTLPYAQATIRVKGNANTTFKLSVNGEEVGPKQVGKKSVVPDKQLQAWEFVAVALKPGNNTLRLTQNDQFGNVRGEKIIHVTAPDKLGKLKIVVPQNGATADGKTAAKIRVLLTDSRGVPVTVRTPVTLETSAGEWQVKDLDPNEPGVQVFIEKGAGEFMLLPTMEPGQATIRATSGTLKAEAALDLLPELRPMLAAGVMELGVNFSNGVSAPGAQNAFEQKLSLLSADNSDSTVDSGTRAAAFMKGRIPGDNLLTFAYDSEKTTKDRLFRDIQPDEFFPVYGDSSQHGYDAQSTGKTYVRVDHGKSYALYGDFLTNDNMQTLTLSNYSRSMTGTKEHFENGHFSVTGFASHDSLTQVVDEIPANGTSGPYQLTNSNGVENSEKVEIITRDRNQPSIIIDTKPQTRFSDYEFEPFTGRLLFKAPVPSLDEFLNPISIRVTYEADQGGQKFWVGGAEAHVKMDEHIAFGFKAVGDGNPLDRNNLLAADQTVSFNEKTKMTVEVAQTQHENEHAGLGYRMEFTHRGERLDTKAFYGATDTNFDNPNSMLNKGRGEAGVKLAFKMTENTRLLLDSLRTRDAGTSGVRTGVEAAVERTFEHNLQVRLGYRHAQETAAAATDTTLGVTPNKTDSLFGRISAPVPYVPKASVNAEYEQDVLDSAKRMAAIGANYQIYKKTKLYLRHELISSLDSTYALNTAQTRNVTLFGVESDVTKAGNTHLFSEYRTRNVIDTQGAEAAIGLRNTFTVRKGLSLNAGVENIHTISGTSNESLALTGGVEYTASDVWRGSARMEWRGSGSTSTILNTVGMAASLNKDWTFLARNVVSTTQNNTAGAGNHVQDRMQSGFAYRDDRTNRWNALGMIEFKVDDDNTSPLTPTRHQAIVFSGVTDFKVSREFQLSNRYAAKLATDDSNNLRSSAFAQLLSTRGTYQFAQRWDVSLAGSTMLTEGASWGQFGLGGELGYALMKNLWVSTGYNVLGYRDQDLTGDDVTHRGAFIRMRFKFDENIFKPKGESK